MTQSARAARRATAIGLNTAVHRSKALSRAGVLERLFTFAFRGLVYPQIWEDPVVDMAALQIRPGDHVVAIASGSCNILSYLTADPARISAVDLNGAHIALGQLKLAALRQLPDYDAFLRLFGKANSRDNVGAYDSLIKPHLDATSRAYWEARSLGGRRRIAAFSDNFYRHGLLGKFIGAGHLLARIYGCDPGAVLKARNLSEQRVLFDRHLAPIFDKTFLRWLIRQPASLYGLGIPPSQYRSLSQDLPDGIAAVLRQRLERLACGFDITTNYFAWQAFGRGYAMTGDEALPPYLQRRNFDAVRARADRVRLQQRSLTEFLKENPEGSVDCYVLLDAQDWMNDDDLTALWGEITRTARQGARVIFRTAADERLLPGRLPSSILDAWSYDHARSREGLEHDRSSIYGAFHLYRLAERPA
ncbi:S-adenosylmethionine-diacylglycerol 3-amino-3-carboxypropyl transferase [Rhizobiales bacterium GAS191]|nr:S-adenosylmethionine-diacylglycerol 3-amino-3-carboxypropyl transferase [Rhizobiales bacterium GAS113]SEE21621.1 S-adenosylmethionine-diacylglycerol 3-amino-3-carboxypropyl transferase [Rhizobiales bacterium GAS188]SEE35403.1 S-adenosylmethionine-diacylglycerol 3-amino-3-carboxypropyl transferase [Rhizobiales bacterium GAS191]